MLMPPGAVRDLPRAPPEPELPCDQSFVSRVLCLMSRV
jgi:hypothetical protein